MEGQFLQEDLEKILKIEPNSQWNGRKVREIVVQLSMYDGVMQEDFPDYPEKITEAAEALRSRREALDRKRRTERVRRPKGHRDRILAEVAAWATSHYGVAISPRFVEDCIEEYPQAER